MIAWINFTILLFASLFFLYFYVLSVGPAGLEKVTGPQAYARCAHYRIIAIIFEMVTLVNYILYAFFPLSLPLPEHFGWSWWVSIAIGVVIGLPSIGLMIVGLRDAGPEAVAPKKEHAMYHGNYTQIRHPQAAGEVFSWIWIGFLLHSPALVVFGFVYFPIFLVMCWAEEQDLLMRYGDAYAEYMRSTSAFFPKRRQVGTK